MTIVKGLKKLLWMLVSQCPAGADRGDSMDSDKYSRLVTLLCPTCGNSLFEQSEDDENQEGMIHCPSCDRTMSKSELIRENGEVVDGAVDEMNDELLADAQKEVLEMLRNAFKGSKYIRIG